MAVETEMKREWRGKKEEHIPFGDFVLGNCEYTGRDNFFLLRDQ